MAANDKDLKRESELSQNQNQNSQSKPGSRLESDDDKIDDGSGTTERGTARE